MRSIEYDPESLDKEHALNLQDGNPTSWFLLPILSSALTSEYPCGA
jgi:hypothetical protein